MGLTDYLIVHHVFYCHHAAGGVQLSTYQSFLVKGSTTFFLAPFFPPIFSPLFLPTAILLQNVQIFDNKMNCFLPLVSMLADK